MAPFVLAPLLAWAAATTAHAAVDPPCAIAAAPRTVEYPWMSVARWHQMLDEQVNRAAQGDIDVMFVGDSLTEMWPKAQWEANFGGMKAANFGIGGDHTGNVLWRLQQPAIAGVKPKLVVLMIGVNNINLCNEQPQQVFAGIEAVVARLRAQYPAARILLNAVLPEGRTPDEDGRQRVLALNRMVQTLGDDRTVFFHDYGARFVAPDGTLSAALQPDFLHMSEQGYKVFAAAMRPDIEALLKRDQPVAQAEAASRIDWWRQSRFGMFIHWGLYAIPGRGEWVQWNERIPVGEYAKLADQFKPEHFDADAWAQLAKAAGMKYTVLTARHHDGFAMFDDGDNPFSSVNSAAHRDFVAEYVKAVRKAGLGVGLYYSPLDWRYPGFFFPDLQRENAEAMRAQYHRQMEKLASNYGKLDVLWFDGGEADWLSFAGDWGGAEAGAGWKKRADGKHYAGGFSWQSDQVYSQLRKLQPQLLVNGRADMPEDFHSREGDGALGDYDDQHPWELCTTIAGAWGYQPNMKPKPLKHYVQLLANVAGRDGNLLLNVGPGPDGRIDGEQAQRLREIGAWLGKHGQSIYGTRGGPFLPGAYGASTRSGNTIYVHVLQWPGDTLKLPALPARITGATLLAGGAVRYSQSGSGIELSVPPGARDAMDTVIALQLDGPAAAIRTLRVAD
ncbi:hypothetical protein RugamoR64_49550 [Duganella rhizosphaerae]